MIITNPPIKKLHKLSIGLPWRSPAPFHPFVPVEKEF
jgi:hypothetical protein